MSKSRQYKTVRNLIHNEMQLTKDEVKELIADIAKQEVKRIITEDLITLSIDKSVDNMLKRIIK